MRLWTTSITAGVITAICQPQLIPITGCLLLAACACLFLFWWHKLSCRWLFSFCMALIYASLWGQWQLEQQLPASLKRTDWLVQGRIDGIPNNRHNLTSFILKVVKVSPYQHQVTDIPKITSLKLNWYYPKQPLHSGQELELIVRLKPPHGMVNPNAVDYERWLLARGIDATGYIRRVIKISENSNNYIDSIREKINAKLREDYPEPRINSLLMALTTGSNNKLTQTDWDSLRVSGALHLAVISGLHLGFMAIIGWWFGRLLGFIWIRHSRIFPYILAFGFITAYLVISGADIPAQRAFIMIATLLLSGWRQFHLDIWTRWWLALTVVLLFSPIAVFDIGLWLSFTAVALLFWLGRAGWSIWQILKLQILFAVGMLPLYLLFFSGFSLAAPVVNILAIPLMTILVPFIFINLILSQLGIEFLIPLESELVNIFWWLIDQVAAKSWVYQKVDSFQGISILFAVVGTLIAIMPRGIVSNWLIIPCFLPVLLGVKYGLQSENEFKAWVYDVGQGTAIMVEVGDYHLIYDTGASYKSGGSAFERSVQPHLEMSRINHINHLILSHDDNDHTGGFNALKTHAAIDKIYTSFKLKEANQQLCHQGMSWQVREVKFSFLSGSKGTTDNDRSCVLLIQGTNCSLLLPGDISGHKEKEIINILPENITWLVAAHHGSRFSSTRDFLSRLKPEAVIFTAGFANQFNHPHPKAIKRVNAVNSNIFSTSNHGAVILNADKKGGCTTKTWRQEVKRFWR